MNPSDSPNPATQPPSPNTAGYAAPTQPVIPHAPVAVGGPQPVVYPGNTAAQAQPAYSSQPMQPVPGPTPQPSQNVTGIPFDNLQKQKKQIWLMVAGSFVIFVVGLVVGFAALLGAVLGAFASRKARLINYKPGIIAGIVGTLLNAGFYLLAVLSK